MAEETTKPEPEDPLQLSAHLLGLRDFAASREYALLARQSTPTMSEPAQILAVADVLLASKRRLPRENLDWYSILQIDRPDCDNIPAIRARFKKFMFLLNPVKDKLPFARDAINLVCDAWSVLSNLEKKSQYDKEISVDNGAEKRERIANEHKFKPNMYKNGTIWTVCPYCYYLYEYEKLYEDCCLRCQNCRRPFHGLPVAAPPLSVLEGKEYYWGWGLFPVGNSGDGLVNEKKGNGVDSKKDHVGKDNVVEILDDSDDDEKKDDAGVKVNGSFKQMQEELVKKCGNKIQGNEKVGEAGDVMQGIGTQVNNYGKRPMRNVKSVAKSTKKMMGRGLRIAEVRSMNAPGVGGEVMMISISD